MDSKLKRIYVPMTETGFYILFCLQTPQHGYGISQQVRRMTGGTLTISAGTMAPSPKWSGTVLSPFSGKKKTESSMA